MMNIAVARSRTPSPSAARGLRSGSTSSSDDEVRWSPAAVHEAHDPLEVLSARYEPLRRPEPWKTRFVTDQIRMRITRKGAGWRLFMKREFNRYFGDPCPGEPKQLVVVFRVGNRVHEFKWVEGAAVNVDAFTLAAKKKSSIVSSPRLLTARVPSATAPNNNFPHPALPIIMSFLPVYPDRVLCQLVCKEWALSFATNGLTEEFRVGAPDIPGPCYLDQPPSFVEMIVSKSRISLRILNLDGFRSMTDDVAYRILRSAERLTHLDLTDCARLHDESVMCIGSTCPQLTALTLKRCTLLTDVSLVPITQGCLQLERLDLSELKLITDETLETIGRNLKSLRALFLRENHKLTDRGISTLCSSSERKAGSEKKRRTDATLTLRKLRELSLAGLHRLTSRSLTGFPIPCLRSLTLEGCSSLDDMAIEELCHSASAKTLLSLNLRYCHKLTDRAAEDLSRSMPHIQHLNLCYLYHITDQALISIAENLLDLRSLDCSHCLKISNSGILRCMTDLVFLSELKICACKQFDENTILAGVSALVAMRRDTLSLNLLDARDTRILDMNAALGYLQRLDNRFSETSRGCFVRW